MRVNPSRWTLLPPVAAALAVGLAAAAAGCGDDGSQPQVSDPCKSGNVCTWAGTGEPALGLDHKDRLATEMYWPMDLDFGPDGRGYVIDWQNHLIRRVDADGKMTIVIGTDTVGDGPASGNERVAPGVLGTTVNLNHPTDVTFDANGTLVVAAWHNHKIRRLDTATDMVDVACGAGPGFKDGTGDIALMNRPKAVALDPTSGALFVVDTTNLRIRRISGPPPYQVDTVAGTAMRGFAGDGGPPLQAQFAFQQVNDNPEPGGGIAVDAQGLLYVLDTENQRVRRIDLMNDRIDTIAGNGTAGFSGDGGPATDASLNFPRDLEIGPDGRLYIADSDNHRVRAVDLTTGIITTVAGSGQAGFGGDGGPPLAASLARPFGIAFDAAGNLFVADTFNNRIREIVK